MSLLRHIPLPNLRLTKLLPSYHSPWEFCWTGKKTVFYQSLAAPPRVQNFCRNPWFLPRVFRNRWEGLCRSCALSHRGLQGADSILKTHGLDLVIFKMYRQHVVNTLSAPPIPWTCCEQMVEEVCIWPGSSTCSEDIRFLWLLLQQPDASGTAAVSSLHWAVSLSAFLMSYKDFSMCSARANPLPCLSCGAPVGPAVAPLKQIFKNSWDLSYSCNRSIWCPRRDAE